MRSRLFIACTIGCLLFGCQGAEREIYVESPQRRPIAGATVSILPSQGETNVATTDVNGIARFGRGDWSDTLSIKVSHDGKVLFDAVQTRVKGHRITIQAASP